jgi:Transglycosylase SLT domain
MATSTISAPISNFYSPANWGSRASIKAMLEKINTKYGSFIKVASENSKIPAKLIASFIAVESGGNPLAGGSSSPTQGLMQWNRNYADETLETEYKQGRLTPEEKSILAKYGIKFDANGNTRTITQADQIKPELNILIGSMLLGQYADSYIGGGKSVMVNGVKRNWAIDENNGQLRLDRIISVYNAGAYGAIGERATKGSHANPKALADAQPSPTNAYIAKMYGINGTLDILSKELSNIL